MKRLTAGPNAAWYVPNQESPLTKLTQKALREYRKPWLLAAIAQLAETALAVEVGAHVGLETGHLAAAFREVFAFEPATENLACLAKNLRPHPHVRCLGVAMGESAASCEIISLSDEDTRQRYTNLVDGECQMTTIDQAMTLESTRRKVSLLKVSVCGFELSVLKGARSVLQQSRPAVLTAKDARLQWRYGSDPQEMGSFLGGLGYRRHESDGEEELWLPR